jgi:hypothetical protein
MRDAHDSISSGKKFIFCLISIIQLKKSLCLTLLLIILEESLKGEVMMNEPVVTCTTTIVLLFGLT